MAYKKVSLNSINSAQKESAFWVQTLFMTQAILHFWAPPGQNWTRDEKRGYAKGAYIHLSNVFHKKNFINLARILLCWTSKHTELCFCHILIQKPVQSIAANYTCTE